MTLLIRPAFAVVSIFAISSLAWSGELAGRWQEYDDDSGKLVALIRIERLPDNSYEGTIEQIFPGTGEDSELVCGRCPSDLHNHLFKGLRILSGMKRKDKRSFEGGEILDPDEGKAYHCRIRLSDDGNRIEVFGYSNLSLIGQSEIWRRAD